MTQVQENILSTRHQPTDMPCLDDILNIDEEIKQIETKMAKEPVTTELFARLSELYFEVGNVTQAQEYAKKVLEMNPDDFMAYAILARVDVLKESIFYDAQWNENAPFDPRPIHLSAHKILRKLIRISDIRDINAREAYHIAETAMMLKRFDLAKKYVEWAFKKNQKNADVLVLMAFHCDSDEEKISLLERALDYEPHNMSAHQDIAHTYFNAGNKEKARYHEMASEQIRQKRGLNGRQDLYESGVDDIPRDQLYPTRFRDLYFVTEPSEVDEDIIEVTIQMPDCTERFFHFTTYECFGRIGQQNQQLVVAETIDEKMARKTIEKLFKEFQIDEYNHNCHLPTIFV